MLLLVSTLCASCGETSPAGPGRVTPLPSGAADSVNGTVLDVSTEGISRPVPNLHLTVWHSPLAVESDQVRTIVARKEGYVSITREIFGGWEPFVHFTLTRN